jgi:hypothetical protein
MVTSFHLAWSTTYDLDTPGIEAVDRRDPQRNLLRVRR